MAHSSSHALMVFTIDARRRGKPTFAATARASISLGCILCDHGVRLPSEFGMIFRGQENHERGTHLSAPASPRYSWKLA